MVKVTDRDREIVKELIKTLAQRDMQIVNSSYVIDLENIIKAAEAWRERAMMFGQSLKVFDAILNGKGPDDE